MKNSFNKEIKLFFSKYSWVFVIIILFIYGFYSINNYLEILKSYETTSNNIINITSGQFINIYNVMKGFYSDTTQIVTIPLVLILTILSNTSLSSYIDEKKGFIKYEYLRISKKEYLISKILTNSILVGIVFIIPNILLLIYYSFLYSYHLPIISNINDCKNLDVCNISLISNFYNINFPILNIFIDHIFIPFLIGVTISLVVITFSFITNRKSLLMLYTNGFMFVFIVLFLLFQQVFSGMSTKHDQLDEIFSFPFIGWYSSDSPSHIISLIISIFTILFIVIGLLAIFWRKQKYEI